MPATRYTQVRARRERRAAQLQRLGFADYPAYLKSAAWAAMKARYRASDFPQDCMCGETENLQLHHLTYERVGQEEVSDLSPLCATCHAMIHALELRGDIELDFTGLVNEHRAQRNRAAIEARIGRQQGEFTRICGDATEAREAKAQANRLRSARVRANRRGADISAEVALIDAAISRMVAKLKT